MRGEKGAEQYFVLKRIHGSHHWKRNMYAEKQKLGQKYTEQTGKARKKQTAF